MHRLKVIFKHALKNALIPVVTYVGPMVAYILTGSMVVENIFTIGGLGTEFVTSIVNRDYTMTVSYTHLDVYKRQSEECIPAELVSGGWSTLSGTHFPVKG